MSHQHTIVRCERVLLYALTHEYCVYVLDGDVGPFTVGTVDLLFFAVCCTQLCRCWDRAGSSPGAAVCCMCTLMLVCPHWQGQRT